MPDPMDVRAPAPVTTTAPPDRPQIGEPSLGELFKELAEESSVLIRQEVALAKTEMRDNFRSLARDAALLAVGGGVLLVGLLVLTAFLVAGLGALLDGQYWLSALIVGAVYALAGAVLLMRGRKGLQETELKPEQSMASLRRDKEWAQAEANAVKRDLIR